MLPFLISKLILSLITYKHVSLILLSIRSASCRDYHYAASTEQRKLSLLSFLVSHRFLYLAKTLFFDQNLKKVYFVMEIESHQVVLPSNSVVLLITFLSLVILTYHKLSFDYHVYTVF